MSTDKAFLTYGNRHLIDITIECISSITGRVFVVGKKYNHPLLSGSLKDGIQDIGPIAGILAALRHSDTDYNFFTGVDYPFIDERLILILLSLLKQKGSEYEGIIPVAPDGPHPLFAFYRKSCLPSVVVLKRKITGSVRSRYTAGYISHCSQKTSKLSTMKSRHSIL
jgi:molybdopterin-guanine dinucleotide biosynthesis protein A